MSKVLNIIYNFFEDIGRARTAHQLAVLGRLDMAKEVIVNDSTKFEVHP